MTKAELAARVEHLEQRIAALEQQDGRTLYVARAPTLAEIHVEILHRAAVQLGFKATTALEDLGPDLLADLDEL